MRWDKDGAMLRIARSAEDSTSSSTVFFGPDIAVHLKITARLWLIVIIVLTLALGTFLSALDKETLTSLLKVAAPHVLKPEEVAQNLSLPLKGLGPLILAVGAFLGFRKLPGPSSG